MSERYLRWIGIFKQLNEHSPTREEIDLIAPPHVRGFLCPLFLRCYAGGYSAVQNLSVADEYYTLHPPKKVIPKPVPKVRLKRSFDERDCLRKPILKRHLTDVSRASGSATASASGSKTPPSGEELQPRRPPRKHPSSVFSWPVLTQRNESSLPVALWKNVSPRLMSPRKNVSSRPVLPPKNVCLQNQLACRSVGHPLQSSVLQDTQQAAADFIFPTSAERSTVTSDTDGQSLRRSPGKHPSSSPDLFLSPQKPMLLTKPIVSSRLSSLLGSVDIEDEKENTGPSSSSSSKGSAEDGVSKEQPEEGSEENVKEDNEKPFPDERDYVKKRVIKKKNENYRRLKMKKCYVRGTSHAKKKFKKWRRNRNRR